MTMEEDEKLRVQIARVIRTRPKFVTIRSAGWETPELYVVQASCKGFYYMFYLRDGEIIKALREI